MWLRSAGPSGCSKTASSSRSCSVVQRLGSAPSPRARPTPTPPPTPPWRLFSFGARQRCRQPCGRCISDGRSRTNSTTTTTTRSATAARRRSGSRRPFPLSAVRPVHAPPCPPPKSPQGASDSPHNRTIDFTMSPCFSFFAPLVDAPSHYPLLPKRMTHHHHCHLLKIQ